MKTENSEVDSGVVKEPYCETHKIDKTKLELPFNTGIRYYCPICAMEREKRVERDEAEDRQVAYQAAINRRIENALIAPRFRDKTLAGYMAPTKGQKTALDAAKSFVDNFKDSPGLIFIGGPGTGKNHLAAGIAFEIINKGKTALFVELSKAIRLIKESWKKEGEAESTILKSFLLPDLLIIDELGVQFKSDTERLYLTEIVNDRYAYMKPTVLIGNLTPTELKDLVGDRILDRFREGGKMVIFDWKSYRGTN